MSEPSEALASAVRDRRREPDQDKLDQVRKAAARVRDIDREVSDLEERVKALGSERFVLTSKTLVDLLDAAGVDTVGLPADGNLPAMDVTVAPYYKASIAAEWPEERRERAFALLADKDAGDLIRTTVTFNFGKGDYDKAMKFANDSSQALQMPVEVKKAVPWTSLTAWLKEFYQVRRSSLSGDELQTLGASAGRIVQLKPRKE